jgi:hypothetical protein
MITARLQLQVLFLKHSLHHINNKILKMKTSKAILNKLLFYFLSILLIQNISAQHTSHFKEYYPGGYWLSGLNGDTIHMNKGVYTYISGENCNNITFLPDEGTEMRNGINFINSTNVHIAGYDSITGKHKLYIHDAIGNAIEAGGKCDNWIIDGVDIYNVYSCLWFKTDPDQFHIKNRNGQDSLDKTGHIVLDTTGWHYVMDGLTIKHCAWKRANFDLAYIGNTDPQGKRTYWVNGQWVHVIPNPVAHVYIEDLQCDTAYRSIVQVSGLKDSLIVKNSSFKNAGINSYLDADGKNQGANFIIGGANNPIYASITNCDLRNSNLYNFRSQAGGNIIFKNNTTDSATAVYRIGQGFGINLQQMAAVEFDNPVPTLIDFENNNIGYSNNGISFVAYGNATTGSKFIGNKIKGLFQNFTGVQFDTTSNTKDTTMQDTTKEIPKDTTIEYFRLDFKTATATFYRADESIEIFYDVDRCVGNITKKNWRVVFKSGKSQIVK